MVSSDKIVDLSRDKEEPDPLRNFTAKQLRHFDGTRDEKEDTDKPVYISVNGTVFDVSDGRGFYGPGASTMSSSIASRLLDCCIRLLRWYCVSKCILCNNVCYLYMFLFLFESNRWPV
jgi:hypothetical protein